MRFFCLFSLAILLFCVQFLHFDHVMAPTLLRPYHYYSLFFFFFCSEVKLIVLLLTHIRYVHTRTICTHLSSFFNLYLCYSCLVNVLFRHINIITRILRWIKHIYISELCLAISFHTLTLPNFNCAFIRGPRRLPYHFARSWFLFTHSRCFSKLMVYYYLIQFKIRPKYMYQMCIIINKKYE